MACSPQAKYTDIHLRTLGRKFLYFAVFVCTSAVRNLQSKQQHVRPSPIVNIGHWRGIAEKVESDYTNG
jgi:hypothetical protein